MVFIGAALNLFFALDFSPLDLIPGKYLCSLSFPVFLPFGPTYSTFPPIFPGI